MKLKISPYLPAPGLWEEKKREREKTFLIMFDDSIWIFSFPCQFNNNLFLEFKFSLNLHWYAV